MLKPNGGDWHESTMRGREGLPLPIAVVAGLGLNGLGVVRSLAAERVPIIALDTDLARPTASTRFGRKIKVPALSGIAFIDSLLGVAESLAQKPVLFLTQEGSVETIAARHSDISASYRFTMPCHDTMKTLLNKASFQRVAEESQSMIPRAIRLTRDTNMEAMLSLRFPCVIKPLKRNDNYSAKFKKAYKVASAGELDKLWRTVMETAGEMIAQEWIEGGDSDVYFCLQYRPRLAPPVSFVGRKLCQWPPLVGGTATCISAPQVSDELIAATNAFFERVGFVGLGSMEYKRDPRDGRFYMVEPTVGRTDYQEEVATLNGVNIPYATYCGEIGRPYSAIGQPPRPRLWRDLPSYLNARAAGARDPLLDIPPGAKVIDAHFRAGDPMPYLLMKMRPLEHRFRRWFYNESAIEH